jgi:RNA polymerase primary sigma factor
MFMEDIYYKYLQDIAKYPKLSQSEEVKLIYRAQDGDEKALEILVQSNLKFVIHVAKKYVNQGLELLDLISEGNIGLIKSIMRFDPTTGNKLITYSVWWIKQKILKSISNDSRIIRLPLNRGATAKELVEKLENQEYNRPLLLTINEICEEYELSEYELVTLISIYNISSEYYKDDITTDCDFLLVDSFFEKLTEPEVELFWKNELKILTDREKFIAEKYYDIFGSSWTLQDIGDELGLTRERVRQLKERAIKKLEKSVSLGQFEKIDFIEYIHENTINSHFCLIEKISCFKSK